MDEVGDEVEVVMERSDLSTVVNTKLKECELWGGLARAHGHVIFSRLIT